MKKNLFTTEFLKKPRINLTKEVKDLYTENYDIDEKIEEDTNKWREILC